MTIRPMDITPRTRLVFGNGALNRLGELARDLGAHRALIVTDPGIVRAGHADRARKSLEQVGISVAVHDEVRENPTTLDVDRCLDVARGRGIDLFIGLGGGSSIDTAKGANFLLTNGGRMQDYWGVGKATRPMLSLIAIPTTAGTGSECQSAALIADEVTHQKMACLDPKVAARIALLDPELTVSQPARVTALTGTDALSHALESAVTTKRNALSWMYSLSAFQNMVSAFPRVLSHPDDLEARGQMLLGAAFAGLAIEASMLGGAHACANPLTARLGVVHGAAVGLMLPAVVRFNAAGGDAIRGMYVDLAIGAGLACRHDRPAEVVESLVAWIERMQVQAGIPRTLREAGGDEAMIPTLSADAQLQWTGKFNPRPLEVEDFQSLYRAVC